MFSQPATAPLRAPVAGAGEHGPPARREPARHRSACQLATHGTDGAGETNEAGEVLAASPRGTCGGLRTRSCRGGYVPPCACRSASIPLTVSSRAGRISLRSEAMLTRAAWAETLIAAVPTSAAPRIG